MGTSVLMKSRSAHLPPFTADVKGAIALGMELIQSVGWFTDEGKRMLWFGLAWKELDAMAIDVWLTFGCPMMGSSIDRFILYLKWVEWFIIQKWVKQFKCYTHLIAFDEMSIQTTYLVSKSTTETSLGYLAAAYIHFNSKLLIWRTVTRRNRSAIHL